MNWREWIHTHGSWLGRRVGWFDGGDYEVVFDEVVLPDGEGPCEVTLIANLRTDGDLTFNLFGVQLLNQLLSDLKLPQRSQTESQTWGQTLLEDRCLSVGLGRDGVGHIDFVGTQWAQEYGGCGCFSRGRSLVQLADLVARKFDQKRLTLKDDASIQCRQSSKVETSLGFFYALKTGHAWYQSLGYQYEDPQAISAVESAWAIGNWQLDWSNSALKTPLSWYQDHVGGQENKTNRDFVLWVWEKHCSQWAMVVDAIFGETPGKIRGFMSKPIV